MSELPLSEHPVVPAGAVGIIPNPMSGRDIRRVVAQASVFPNTEKASMVLRIIRAVGALGVQRVLRPLTPLGSQRACCASSAGWTAACGCPRSNT